MENNKKMNTMYMVEMALLIAIILIMAFTPIGYIRTFGLEITLIVVPVAVGAVTLGPTAGAVLGAVFGITSFIQCFGMSPFGAVLLSINPIYTFIVCVLSRILMGGLTGLLYKIFQKSNPLKKISVMLANLCCPILNTLFFMALFLPDGIYPGHCPKYGGRESVYFCNPVCRRQRCCGGSGMFRGGKRYFPGVKKGCQT